MRSSIYLVLMLSVLCTSIEGAADVILDGVPHGDDAAHQAEFGHTLDAHENGSPIRELDGDHCNHCCHGHVVGIIDQVTLTTTPFAAGDLSAILFPQLRNFGQAPPTPPPNV